MNTNGTPKPPPAANHRPASAPPRSLDELVKQRDAEPGTDKPAQPTDDAGRSGGGKNAGGAPGGGGNGSGANGGGKGASGSANGGGKGGGRSGGGTPRPRKRVVGVRRRPWHPSTILAGLASSALTLGTGGLALVAVVMSYFVADRPDVDKLRIPNRPTSITVMSDDGEIMGRRGTVHAGLVTFQELPDHLVQAVIAIEDQRFFDHIGVDFQGTARAAWANYQAGHVVQGGSTLTQQLAKNLFLRPDRTIRRKIQEMILALRLEGAFSKREILEMYLNRVYFGAGVYGIEAAAERYFEKSARDLTLSESAMLAGLLKAPSFYSPTSNKDRAINRAQVVLRNMTEAGFINEEDRFVAEQVLRMPRARSENHELAPFVLDWVAESLPDFVGEPKGDLVIETTIDLALQDIAEEAAARIIAEEGEAKHVEQASVVLMSNNGAVRALVGGLDYADSQFNRAIKALRQPGSTFKVFVYSAALEYGYSPWDQRYDQPIRIGDWEPKNYGNTYRGPVTIHEALTRSINTISAQVTAEIGPEAVVGMAHRLGISSNLEAVPSIALGTGEVTLYELTGAFTAFANGGEVAVPHVIKRVLAADGRVLFERAGSSGGLVLSPIEVSDMNMMLESVVNAGTGRRARLDDRPSAGKTGTTQDYRDAWFIGYTGQYTAGVWVGNDDNSEMKRVTGGSIPATIWHEVMAKVHEGLPVLELQSTSDLPPMSSEPQPYASRSPLGSFLNNLFGVRQPQPPTYARRYGGYGDGYRDRYGRDPYDGNRYGARDPYDGNRYGAPDPYNRRPLTYPGVAARGANGLPAYEVLPLDRRGLPLPPGQAYGAPGGQPWAGQVQRPEPQPQRREDQPKTRTRIFFGNRQVN